MILLLVEKLVERNQTWQLKISIDRYKKLVPFHVVFRFIREKITTLKAVNLAEKQLLINFEQIYHYK